MTARDLNCWWQFVLMRFSGNGNKVEPSVIQYMTACDMIGDEHQVAYAEKVRSSQVDTTEHERCTDMSLVPAKSSLYHLMLSMMIEHLLILAAATLLHLQNEGHVAQRCGSRSSNGLSRLGWDMCAIQLPFRNRADLTV